MANILVVDDEIGIRELLSEILTDEGHQVYTADCATHARMMIAQVDIDLILLDVWMPDTDGITLLKEWDQDHSLHCPVLMMSGHGTIETALEATKYGASGFLEKPISMQNLISTIRTVIDMHMRTRMYKDRRIQPQQKPLANVTSVPFSVGKLPRLLIEGTTNVLDFNANLKDFREAAERSYFETLIRNESCTMSRVANRAGLERTHLYRKIRQLGLDIPKERERTANANQQAKEAESSSEKILLTPSDISKEKA